MEIRDGDGTAITVERSLAHPGLIRVEIFEEGGGCAAAYLELPAVLKLMEAFHGLGGNASVSQSIRDVRPVR